MLTPLRPFPPLTTSTRFALAIVFLPVLTSLSAPPSAEAQTIQLSAHDLHLAGNISNDEIATRMNTSNGLQIQCDGEKYGFNPVVRDCQSARAYYKSSSEPITYGERHSGHDIDAFPLPFRLMGDEALCYLEPVLIDSSKTGVSSVNQLGEAAYALIVQCAVRQARGGIATGIGGDNMGLVLGTYQPDVQCRGAFSTWASCRALLVDMPILTMPQIFGPEDDPAAQVILPQALESGDGKCILRIFGKEGSDVSSWFKIWEAVSALYAVCVKHRKVGSFRGLGELGTLFLTITAKTPQLGNTSTFADHAVSES